MEDILSGIQKKFLNHLLVIWQQRYHIPQQRKNIRKNVLVENLLSGVERNRNMEREKEIDREKNETREENKEREES